MKKTNIALIVTLLAAVAGSLQAQDAPQATAQIQGVIRDFSGGPIGGAEVIATEVETNETATTTSNEDGTYSLKDLPAGNYRLEVKRTGFFGAIKSDVEVADVGAANADVSLGLNLAHIHIVLNHFPTVGFGVALALFFVALAGKSDDLKRASLVMFFMISLLVIPIYTSGNAAAQSVSEMQASLTKLHEDAALIAFIFMQVTGLWAWVALWQYRRKSVMSRSNLLTVLVLSIVTFGLMARAANLGGELRHSEIRAAMEPADQASSAWLQTEAIAAASRDNPWLWPGAETIHFIGLAVLFGVVLVVNLRMLGVMKNVSYAALHTLLPIGMGAFAANLLTGMFFFIATPEQYTQNIAFYWKVILMLIGGANLFYLTVFDDVWVLGPGDNASARSKFVASFGILSWACVIYLGRMLPFLGNSF